MTPQEIFYIIHALRQLLVRSEANILPLIAPEILGLNGILVPIAIQIPGHVPEICTQFSN